MLNRRSNARLRSASTAFAVSSATTAPLHLVADPDRMRRAHDRRLPVATWAPLGREDAGERALDVAAGGSAPPRSSLKSSVGCLEHQRVQRVECVALDDVRDARKAGRRLLRRACGRCSDPGAREHVAFAVDDPDARGRARQPLHDLRDLRRRRRRQRVLPRRSSPRSRANDAIGRAAGEQARAIVQRGRHRLRGAGERALLRVAQNALELAHVLVAEPRQRKEHVSTSSSCARMPSA